MTDFADRGAGIKATRIINEGRITPVEDAAVYRVVGSTGDIYLTILHGERAAYCTCPSTAADCSHVRAAMRTRALTAPAPEADDPFAGLDRQDWTS